MTTGASNGDFAQDPSSLRGKTLRLRDDGTPAADNPFADQEGYRAEIYSMGHRNQQGLALHPETGVPFATEHGVQGGDELNAIEAGGNYGWRIREGSFDFDNSVPCGLLKIPPVRSLVDAVVPEDASVDDTAEDLIRLDLTYFLLDQTFKGVFFDTAEIFNCNLGTLSHNPDNLTFTISLAVYRALVSLTFATFFLAIVFGGKAQIMRP